MTTKMMLENTPEEMASILVTKFADELKYLHSEEIIEEAEKCALTHIKLLIDYMNVDEVDQPKSLYDYMIDVMMELEKRRL